jgi:hypothetical protein
VIQETPPLSPPAIWLNPSSSSAIPIPIYFVTSLKAPKQLFEVSF